MLQRSHLGKVRGGPVLGLKKGTDSPSPSSCSLRCWAGGPGLVLRADTHGDVPVVRQAERRGGEYGNVYLNVLSLLKSPCH